MTALLFIHGFATGPAIWEKQITEFSRDYQVSTDINLFESLDDVFVLGWSLGGWKAIDLYREFPQKIRGLILVSAFAKYVVSDDYPHGVVPALLKKLERKFQGGFREGLRYFYGLLFKDRAADWQALIDSLPAPEQNDIDRWFEKLWTEDKRPVLTEIKLPVLLIHGEKDDISPAAGSVFLHEKLPDSRLEIFAGAGHLPFLEDPERFNSLVKEFILAHAG